LHPVLVQDGAALTDVVGKVTANTNAMNKQVSKKRKTDFLFIRFSFANSFEIQGAVVCNLFLADFMGLPTSGESH
jgi:hypothetical protein